MGICAMRLGNWQMLVKNAIDASTLVWNGIRIRQHHGPGKSTTSQHWHQCLTRGRLIPYHLPWIYASFKTVVRKRFVPQLCTTWKPPGMNTSPFMVGLIERCMERLFRWRKMKPYDLQWLGCTFHARRWKKRKPVRIYVRRACMNAFSIKGVCLRKTAIPLPRYF